MYLPNEDFALTTFPTLQGRIVADQAMQELLAGNWRVDVDVNLSAFQANLAVLNTTDWFIVRSEDFHVVYDRSAPPGQNTGNISKSSFDSLTMNPTLSVVYSNGGVWLFSIR